MLRLSAKASLIYKAVHTGSRYLSGLPYLSLVLHAWLLLRLHHPA